MRSPSRIAEREAPAQEGAAPDQPLGSFLGTPRGGSLRLTHARLSPEEGAPEGGSSLDAAGAGPVRRLQAELVLPLPVWSGGGGAVAFLAGGGMLGFAGTANGCEGGGGGGEFRLLQAFFPCPGTPLLVG